jgi:hypothetical protein
MNFNFHDKYKEYSNIELLKIVRQPNEYQTDAVDAATSILKEREISETDIQQVDAYFNEIEANAKLKSAKINSYKGKAANFLQPIIKPGAEVTPSKWLNILLLFVGLEYLWILYNSINKFVSFNRCYNCTFDITMALTVVNLIYVPVIFFLLYKKTRWGWILLFADNLFTFIARLSDSYIFFEYQEFHIGDISTFLFSILIKAAFVFFLWRVSISGFFGVTHKAKKDTAIVTTVIAILFLGSMQLHYW